MSASWDPLRFALVPRVRELLGDAWDQDAVREFAELKIEQMAKDGWLAMNGDTEEIRTVHRDNLEDLWAQVKDEALIAARNAAGGFSDFVAEALGVVLKAATGVLLGAIQAKFGGGILP